MDRTVRQSIAECGLYRPDDIEFRRNHESDADTPALPREQQGLRSGLGGRDYNVPVVALPWDRQLAGIGAGLVGGQQRDIGRFANQIDKGQFIVKGDRLIIGRRLCPVA